MAKGDSSTPTGAFGKDKAFGNRLDEMFAAGENFILLAAKVTPEAVDTTFGPADRADLYVSRLNEDGTPKGTPFVVNTLGSAIVEKVNAIEEGELPAVVCWQRVTSKKFGREALVLSYVSGVGDEAFASEAESFGLSAEATSRMLDNARKPSDRLPL